MKLTILNRLKLCFEILTIRSGHKHTAHEKQLKPFLRGYAAGRNDAGLTDQEISQVLRNYVSKQMEILNIPHLDPRNMYNLALVHMNEQADKLCRKEI